MIDTSLRSTTHNLRISSIFISTLSSFPVMIKLGVFEQTALHRETGDGRWEPVLSLIGFEFFLSFFLSALTGSDSIVAGSVGLEPAAQEDGKIEGPDYGRGCGV